MLLLNYIATRQGVCQNATVLHDLRTGKPLLGTWQAETFADIGGFGRTFQLGDALLLRTGRLLRANRSANDAVGAAVVRVTARGARAHTVCEVPLPPAQVLKAVLWAVADRARSRVLLAATGSSSVCPNSLQLACTLIYEWRTLDACGLALLGAVPGTNWGSRLRASVAGDMLLSPRLVGVLTSATVDVIDLTAAPVNGALRVVGTVIVPGLGTPTLAAVSLCDPYNTTIVPVSVLTGIPPIGQKRAPPSVQLISVDPSSGRPVRPASAFARLDAGDLCTRQLPSQPKTPYALVLGHGVALQPIDAVSGIGTAPVSPNMISPSQCINEQFFHVVAPFVL